MLIRPLLQKTVPYGAYHWLSKKTHRVWDPENFGYCDDAGIFYLNHDAGFFSNCSVTLFEIARSKLNINKIDVSESFSWFKTNTDENVWPKYFSSPVLLKKGSYSYWGETLLHHNRYKKLNLRIVEPLIKSYFHPSELVISRQLEFIQKYEIDLSKTLAVNYRGTDKVKEVASKSIQQWIYLTRKKLSTLDPATRLLIQTDQEQVLNYFVDEFGSRSIYFAEMPVTKGDRVIHEILEINERENFAINLLATTLILSNCSSIITHTGNVAYWTAIFRGNTADLIQI